MKIVTTELFTKLLADDGMVICSTDGFWDSSTGIKEIYLGKGDSPHNYFEEPEPQEPI